MTSSRAETPRRVRLDLDLDPLDVLARFRARDRLVALLGAWHHGEALIAFDPLRVADDPFAVSLPPLESPGGFHGGWIGVWGYGMHQIAFYDRVLRRRHGVWWLETLGRTDDDDVLMALATDPPLLAHEVGAFTMTPGADEHRAGVAAAVEHIRAGDIFQVNLCARLEADFVGDPLSLFVRGVRKLVPAYAAYVASPDGAVASFSPELFLRRTGRDVLTSPIKGTAPLASDPATLETSSKNRAENVMIVDLMRNDLGRVAVPGLVRVPSLVRAERHAVWHLVSDVEAELAPGVDDDTLLRATFPPGSVTGAPKIRAMQIAEELEPTRRQAYTGAIGHVSPAAGLELNVAIRTFEIAGDRVWFGVGGGVVADSIPDDEYAECLVKAVPLIEAIGGRLQVDRPEPSLGVFTTVLVEHGQAVDLESHLARLGASVRALYDTALPTPELPDLPDSGRLRIAVVPGLGGVRVSTSVSPLLPAPQTWRLTPRVMPGGLGEHKWVDRRGLDPGLADDVLLIDTDGSVLETGRASIFAVLDGQLVTPPLDGRILPGTMRARVIEQRGAQELPLTLADLAGAELFVTNALRGVVPATLAEPVVEPVVEQADPMPGKPRHARVLFVDNYDSFVFNLVQYVRELGATAEVVRNDEASVEELAAGDFTHVVISPGPGTPADAGVSVELVRRLGPTTPLLGVCLGHQAIAEAYRASVVRAPEVVHGKASRVHHDGLGVHAGLPSPLTVARYHSLAVDEATLPPELIVTSRTADGVVMGLRHQTHPVEGVQWHPESILTGHGHALLATFVSERRLPG